MQGKVVVITGASRGIGAAAAQVFAEAGAKVALLARSGAGLDRLRDRLGADCTALPCDVAKAGSVTQAIDRVMARWGRVDVLINNAGVVAPISRIGDAEESDWGRAIDTNLKAVFHGMRAVIPPMRAQGSGTILTLSSGAAHRAVESQSAYCASKAGAAMLTRVAHLEEAAQGLRIMALSPGKVATDMQRVIADSGVNPLSPAETAAFFPPDWPARALLWMCSANADPWLGQEISLRDTAVQRAVGLLA